LKAYKYDKRQLEINDLLNQIIFLTTYFMRIVSLSVILCFFLSIPLFAQQPKLLPFTLNGTINADTGTIELRLLADPSFYPQSLQNLSAKVENKQFTFQGFLPSPQGFQLLYSQSYVSGEFVLEAGKQSIRFNIDSSFQTPHVQNAAMREYYQEYVPAFEQLRQKRKLQNQRRDSLNKVYQRNLPSSIKLTLEQELKQDYKENDATLLKYVKAHPSSHFAFWKLIYLMNFGYEPIFDTIYHHFSAPIKVSYAGKVLADKLKVASILSVGKLFPSFPVVDLEDKKYNVASSSESNYTLVDFWYSNCAPCIAQFPELKTLYEKYKSKGFEVVGISTDKNKNKQAWQQMIDRHALLWPQYWDIDGKEATKLSINAFPTNVLLDKEGKIIKKNIKPAELNQFLLENINE
jgi:peroxiredoxin